MNRVLLSALATLVAGSASATSYVLEVRGTVQSVSASLPSDLGAATVGEPVRATYAFDTSLFPVANSDGSTYLLYTDLLVQPPNPIRSRITVGGRRFEVDGYPFAADLVGEADHNGIALLPGTLPPVDAFVIGNGSVSNAFNQDPSIASARVRSAIVALVGTDPASNFVVGPVTDLVHSMTLSNANVLYAVLQDNLLVHDPATGASITQDSTSVVYRVDSISLRQCTKTLGWVVTGSKWPDDVVCATSR